MPGSLGGGSSGWWAACRCRARSGLVGGAGGAAAAPAAGGARAGGRDGEQREGAHGQHGVAVEGVPQAELVLVKAGLPLALLEALLHRPASSRRP